LLPFNHPIQSFGTGIAAPLLMGNTMAVKPSPHTPLSALAFGRIINDIVPAGVLNIITGDNDRVAAPLVSHPDVTRIALTGSTEAGQTVTRLAADTLKSVSMELGGKNPLIVFPDADVDFAAQVAVAGMNFKCQSHSCSSTSRVLVHSSLKEAFLKVLVTKIQAIQVGLPLDPDSGMGAVSNKPLYDKIMAYIDAGRAEGARLLTGGGRPKNPELQNGNFVPPAVFADARPHMSIAQEKLYGPVLTVLEWDDYEDMIKVANGLQYGLTAVIVTDDLESAHRAAADLNAGYIEINGPVSFAHGSPYGGWKMSGNDREGNIEELLSYSQVKSVNINFRHNDALPR